MNAISDGSASGRADWLAKSETLSVADELHVDDLQLVRNGHDLPVVIAFDVEDHATVLQHTGAAVLSFRANG